MDKDIHSAAAGRQSELDHSHNGFSAFADEYHRVLKSHSLSQFDAVDLGNGFMKGFADETKGFYKFIGTKDSVNQALLQIGPTLDTAANYYASKIATNRMFEIGRDAQSACGALSDAVCKFAQDPPEQKGELLGHTTLQLLIANLFTAKLQLVAPELRLSLKEELPAQQPLSFPKKIKDAFEKGEQRVITDRLSQPVADADAERNQAELLKTAGDGERNEANLMAESPDGDSRIVAQKLTASPEFIVDMQRYINNLPRELKRILGERGVEFNGVKKINDVVVDPIDNGRGLYKIETKNVYLAEQFKRSGDWITEASSEERVLRHEIGHALDDTGTRGKWLSDRAPFRRAWDKDLSQLSKPRRQYFEHFTDADTGRREAFAEAYAILHTPEVAADRSWRSQFAKTFPNVMKLVEQGNLP